ncbi:MAG: GntR family transcriptional regulator [Dactylosporangium sp.]|nr:GntR family transcriptional regulator [Dactylosporangium sp.]NNJ63305.1 GntR family transcriptional regulator [Dactylosporangium sp.]
MVAFVVSLHGGTPVYRQIASVLRTRILQGTLAPGAELPSEQDLASQFGVGRDSVRDALALLRGEGLIETRRGFKSKIRELPERQRVALPAGGIVTSRMPTPEERVEHDVSEGVPVLIVDGEVYPADRFEVVGAGAERHSTS